MFFFVAFCHLHYYLCAKRKKIMKKSLALLPLLATSALLAQESAITPKKPAIKDECFQVSSAEELYGFAAARMGTNGFETDTTGCMELTKDIVVNKNVLNSDGDLAGDTASYIPWVPVTGFHGTIKGNGHTISGLFVKQDDSEHKDIGFFGTFGGTIEDLHIMDSYIEDGHSTVYHYVGGFVGENYAKGNTRYGITIKKSTFSGTVLSRSSFGVGGFIGLNDAGTIIEESHMSGKVTGKSYIGGFIGQADDVTIKRSFNKANIETTNRNAGGLVGYVSGNFLCNIKITESYNKGNVKGYESAGGLVGYAGYAESKIVNSYNSGTLAASSHIGGIIGATTERGEDQWIYIYNSFNVGTISPAGSYTKYYGMLGELHPADRHELENAFFVKDTLYNDTSIFYGKEVAPSKFEDGTLLTALQNFELDSINGSVWYQDLAQDKHPVLEKRQSGSSGEDSGDGKSPEALARKTLSAGTIYAIAEARLIKIDGMQPNSKFAIFDLRGSVLRQGTANTPSVSFETPYAGTFIVQINGVNKVVKVK